MREGVGEPIIEIRFRRLLERYNVSYIPPGILKGVDFLLSKEFVFVELEDTVKEIYNAINQLLIFAVPVADLFHGVVAIAVPLIDKAEKLIPPLRRFYYRTKDFSIKRITAEGKEEVNIWFIIGIIFVSIAFVTVLAILIYRKVKK